MFRILNLTWVLYSSAGGHILHVHDVMTVNRTSTPTEIAVTKNRTNAASYVLSRCDHV
jgi:hypothetical protein